ncbi:transposase [Dialister hominis]|uniref:transposase n=1 Tax=Dialister hominis TaxID=2582419 RepID=UPI003A8CF35D
MADFERFFKSIGLSLLSRLKAVAMDMNASFNRLFQKYCPKVQPYHVIDTMQR